MPHHVGHSINAILAARHGGGCGQPVTPIGVVFTSKLEVGETSNSGHAVFE